MSVIFALAWIAPTAFGSGVVALLTGRPRTPHEWLACFGYGFVVGALASSIAVALLGRIAVARIVPVLGFSLCALAFAAWFCVVRRHEAPRTIERARGPHPAVWILLSLLVVHAALIADELILRPMYPWDAWAAWLYKPKAWMLGGYVDRFVGFDRWLADGSGVLRTAQSWNYPEALGRIAVWFASAWGEWDAGVVGMIWFALWAALLAGCYGQLRALALSRDAALIAVYALGSLPLIDVHIALAGYADIWIATLLAFACLSWLRWLERRERGQLALAVLLAAMLPLVKLEGAIWLVVFGGAMVYAFMPARLRRIALALAPLIGIGVIVAYLLRWPLVAHAFDRIGFSADTTALMQHAPAVIGAAATGLFAQYNWHLFFVAIVLTLLIRSGTLRASPSLRVFGVFLLLGSAFLFVLFVLTPAGRWAESYTAVNRLTLQIVPSMLVFGALLWRGARFPATTPMAGAVPAAP